MDRIKNFDFLRGIFIYFALLEHYAYYVNVWYPFYYEKANYSNQIQITHEAFLGKYLPIDSICSMLVTIFVIWVSHVYLTMAAFNLAKRPMNELKEVAKSKITKNGILFIAFVFESFFVANTFGEAITLHPILLWMICLSLLVIIYSLFDFLGIIILLLFNIYLYYLINHYGVSEYFQSFIQTHVDKSFYYDARLENFMISALVGFILGYIHYHVKINKKYVYMIISGLILITIGQLLGANNLFAPNGNMDQMFNHEVASYTHYENMIYLQGIQILILSTFLWLESVNIVINNKYINWISYNSLLIFILHKILVIKIWIPLRIIIGGFLGFPLHNNTFELTIYILATFGVAWIIKKSKIFKMFLS